MIRYDIPCAHEKGAPTSESHSDYHPLTKPEIVDLLHTARMAAPREGGTQIAASIQVRLGQGIKGIVCPHEIEGDVARRQYQLDKLYVDYLQGVLQEYSDTEVADEILILMAG